MTDVQAAVLRPGEKSLSIENLTIEDPRDDEVLVRIVASGICHTDMVIRDWGIMPGPAVLGHEGAGIVEKVGSAVRDFKEGDHVGLSFAHCGICKSCNADVPSYCYDFVPLNFGGQRPDGSTSLKKGEEKVHSHFFGQSSFANYAICSEKNLVKVDESLPLEIVGPFGCGFQTGAGAVLNSMKVAKGSSVMVLGAGAVGLAAVMAAANIAGAETVIAVDLNEERMGIAKSVGATHTINGSVEDFEAAVRAICPQGVDYIADTTAYIPAVEKSLPLLAIRGTLGLIAAYTPGEKLSFDPVMIVTNGQKFVGVMEGDTDIKTFIPELLNHYKAGRFPVDKLIRYYDFKDINEAIESSEKGGAIKAIVKMS